MTDKQRADYEAEILRLNTEYGIGLINTFDIIVDMLKKRKADLGLAIDELETFLHGGN